MASVRVIRKIRNMPKAVLYLSNESAFGSSGFWVPKSAILSINDNLVEIADWCKIKTIQLD